MNTRNAIKEGDIYKTISCGGREFVVRYGYYSEQERLLGEIIPILPDFEAAPIHTEEGFPYATAIQDSCLHYSPRKNDGDGWCFDCEHFCGSDEIGVCRCNEKRLNK
ncbi:MAG: hypothetical protein IKM32_02280 [Clostridia bacterium]|nr:hypothetical protein [Clostridia bacterium]